MPENNKNEGGDKKEKLSDKITTKVSEKIKSIIGESPDSLLLGDINKVRSDAEKKRNQLLSQWESSGYGGREKAEEEYNKSDEGQKYEQYKNSLNINRQKDKKDLDRMAKVLNVASLGTVSKKNIKKAIRKPLRNLGSFSSIKDSIIQDADKEFEAGKDQGGDNEAILNSEKKQDKNIQNNKASVNTEEKEEKLSKMRLFFDKLLKSSWENVIDSFGLTLGWIFAHTWLHTLSPKNFCALGHEWVSENVKLENPKLAKKTGDKIGIPEKGLVGCLCFGCLSFIIISIAIVIIMLNPGRFILEVLKSWFPKDLW